MVALEDLFSTPALDVNWDTIVKKVNGGSMRYVRAFIWAALRKHHADVTLQAAGELIDTVGLPGLNAQLQALAASTTPDARDLEVLGIDPPNPQTARPARRRKNGSGAPFKSMHAARA
jgi:hypothetical protein